MECIVFSFMSECGLQKLLRKQLFEIVEDCWYLMDGGGHWGMKQEQLFVWTFKWKVVFV
jgi:hypothetical protein